MTFNSRELSELLFHDQIWFNSIRELIKVGDRKSEGASNIVLDHLIWVGLIHKDEDHLLVVFQQMYRYAVVLVGRLTKHNHWLEGNISVPPKSSLFDSRGLTY